MRKIILAVYFNSCFYIHGMNSGYINSTDENVGEDINECILVPESYVSLCDVVYEDKKSTEQVYVDSNLHTNTLHNTESQYDVQLSQISYLDNYYYSYYDVTSGINNFSSFVLDVKSILENFDKVMDNVYANELWCCDFINELKYDLLFLYIWSEGVSYDIIKYAVKYLFYKSTFLNVYFDLCGNMGDYDEDKNKIANIIFDTFFSSKIVSEHADIILEELCEGSLDDLQKRMQSNSEDSIRDYIWYSYKEKDYYMCINEKINKKNNRSAIVMCKEYITNISALFITSLDLYVSRYKFQKKNFQADVINIKRWYLYLYEYYTESFCIYELKKLSRNCLDFKNFKRSLFWGIYTYILHESNWLSSNIFDSFEEKDKFFRTARKVIDKRLSLTYKHFFE